MNSEPTPTYPSLEDTAFLRSIHLPCCIILAMVSCVGLFGNMSIVLATVRSSHLHGTCNILIAILAFGDFCHHLAHFPYVFLVLSGVMYVPQIICFWIQLLPALMLLHTVCIVLIIGLDRLYCVVFPLKYFGERHQKVYLIFANMPSLIYTLCLTFYSYSETLKDYEQPMLCTITGWFAGPSVDHWLQSTLVVNFATVIIYAIDWVLVKKKTNVHTATRKLMKPLTVMLLLAFFGWFSGILIANVMKRYITDDRLYSALIMYAGILVNAAMASNYFVYKNFATNYKKAFEEMWRDRRFLSINTGPKPTASVSAQRSPVF